MTPSQTKKSEVFLSFLKGASCMYGWTSFVGFFFNNWYFLCDSPYRSDSCHKFFDIVLLLAGDSWKLKKCWKMRKLTILATWKLKSRFLKIKKKINAIRADKHVTSTLRMGGMDGRFVWNWTSKVKGVEGIWT